jgi:hypothetical protein
VHQTTNLTGQWLGHFTYGPEYGDELHGEKVEFRLFIQTHSNGAFKGTAVDLEGIGANFQQALIQGFLDNDLISFTKAYPHYYAIDEWGNSSTHEDLTHPIIHYEGIHNRRLNTFAGKWELCMDIGPVGEFWVEEVMSGTWEMGKDD